MYNQHLRSSVGGRNPRHPRPVVVLDFEAAQRERRERNESLLLVDAGLPGGRNHATYDEIASRARDAERRPDPCGPMLKPLAASVDAAVRTGVTGMVRATFDRIDAHLATLRRQLMARVPDAMRAELWDAPPLFLAFEQETAAEAEADVAQAMAVVRSDDPRLVADAREKTLRQIARDQTFVTACDLTLSRGGHARGVLVTR